MSVVDDPALLAECVGVAGEWLAVGLDPRPERLAAFPWRRPAPPASVESLVDELVAPRRPPLRPVPRRRGARHGVSWPVSLGPTDADFLVAGGASDLDGIRRLRDAGVAGIILGQALLSGAVDFSQALEAAA